MPLAESLKAAMKADSRSLSRLRLRIFPARTRSRCRGYGSLQDSEVFVFRLSFKSSANRKRVMLVLSNPFRSGRKERTDDPKAG